MAAAILGTRAMEAGVPLRVDSAGTSGWHIGAEAHPQTQRELAAHGIRVDHRARAFAASEFTSLDLVLAMDSANELFLRNLTSTPTELARIRLIRSFDTDSPPGAEVPDPYYDEPDRYREVFEMLDAACRGLVDRLRIDGPRSLGADPTGAS